ncbi:MAG: hypothetical protein VB066_05980 [Paludibacter sp.]|nr:hypothetical protein [Paludibacter sp.]
MSANPVTGFGVHPQYIFADEYTYVPGKFSIDFDNPVKCRL